MREEALESICAALSISFSEDPIHLEVIIDRFAEIFSVRDRLKQLRKKCEKFQTFSIELRAVGSSNCTENVYAYIIEFVENISRSSKKEYVNVQFQTGELSSARIEINRNHEAYLPTSFPRGLP